MQEKSDEFVQKAFDFAYKAHRGQYRKGTQVPYIIHPLNVYETLSRYKFLLEIQIGGLFHDLLEDTNVTETEIAQGFGENVLNLVLSVSEKRESKSPSSSDWKERKLHTIQYLKECEEEGTIAIAIADKMDNAISIAKDKIVVGEKIWEKFRAPFLDQKWYYSQLSQTFQAKKNNWGNSIQLLSDQFTDVVHSVFGIY